jgi:3'-phosphoadenosine 5'-phosphosulfate sulfotransferase (PAPS reductase)/FAD synthetase
MTQPVRHILSLSGGKDSAALAIYMRDRVPEMEYIFHDSGVELPETYQYMERLASYLGKPVTPTKPEYNFDAWLKVFGGMIPSSHRRWCTRMLKLKPFEDYVGDEPVVNYVGIRADEDRAGYVSHKSNIKTVCPFVDDGLVRADIIRILEESGLGMPPYTEWGRTRSGCYFCFFQQKIEWVRLREQHPDLFEKAKAYEYANKVNGNPFYWNSEESLEELEQPERIEEIKRNWEQSRSCSTSSSKLVHILGLMDEEEEEEREGCIICFK